MIGKTLAHFRILEKLGAGGMGEVYLARDTRLERNVALKILPSFVAADEDRMQRFIREAKAASALNHPNVATIYDVGEADGTSFIAMECVEGQTLAARIGRRPLDLTEIVAVGIQAADALDAAHAKGITHRDIKPANLMLTPRGQVKVLDFGLAKITRPEETTASSEMATAYGTVAGAVMGTAPYMSPEQVLGRDVDARSDLFSLGVVLYEMTTGRSSFAGVTLGETTDRILHAQLEPVSRLNTKAPAELERIVRKCLEKDAERRYQSARELLVDLRNLKRDTEPKGIDTRAAELGERRPHLPIPLTTFIGRDREVAEVRRILLSTRLLTLTGAGGCGKTRLALQVAADLCDLFSEGIWRLVSGESRGGRGGAGPVGACGAAVGGRGRVARRDRLTAARHVLWVDSRSLPEGHAGIAG